MKIYLIEEMVNNKLYNYLKTKYTITSDIKNADVIIVYKVYDVKTALNMVDEALMRGKEIICIKSEFAKENYVSNYLIKNGAMYV